MPRNPRVPIRTRRRPAKAKATGKASATTTGLKRKGRSPARTERAEPRAVEAKVAEKRRAGPGGTGKEDRGLASARDESGWLDLLITFGEVSLPAPPIPEGLRDQLKLQEQWCWSTLPVDPMAMYFLEPATSEATTSVDYAAVCHAGHGINSYGLCLYIVTKPLAVFVQLSWGGAYSDPQKTQAEIARAFVLVGELLDGAKGSDASSRHVLVFSGFRSEAYFCRMPLTAALPGPRGRLANAKDLFRVEALSNSGGQQVSTDDLDRLFAHAARACCEPTSMGPSLSRLVEAIVDER